MKGSGRETLQLVGSDINGDDVLNGLSFCSCRSRDSNWMSDEERLNELSVSDG